LRRVEEFKVLSLERRKKGVHHRGNRESGDSGDIAVAGNAAQAVPG
jgi:hypothetical protein